MSVSPLLTRELEALQASVDRGQGTVGRVGRALLSLECAALRRRLLDSVEVERETLDLGVGVVCEHVDYECNGQQVENVLFIQLRNR